MVAGVGLKLSAIRAIAKKLDYKEIEHNESSRVVSFRSASGTVRINVYYTTGTVGTCLNHPARGKTQLFRRNVSLQQLEAIFNDPRHHTGKGYYRRTATNQLWKKDDDDDDNDNEMYPDLEWDSARRWKFVASATGLAKTEDQLEAIAKCCTMWDELIWDQGDPPDLEKTKFECGSRAALVKTVLEEAQQLYGNVVMCQMGDWRKCQRGEMLRSDIDSRDTVECCFMDDFQEAHLWELRQFRNQLRSLKKDARTELMQWFVARNSQSVLVNHFMDMIETKHTDRVRDANIAYGHMMYPKKERLCNHCGVLFTYDGCN